MLVKFFYEPVKVGMGDDGFPLYKDEVFVTINRDMTHTVTRKATEEDKLDFAELYVGFRRANANYEELEGFPLEMWAALTPSQVSMLKARNIRTVQALSEMDKSKLPGEIQVLVDHSKVFSSIVNKNSSEAELSQRLSKENELLKEDLAEARKRISMLQAKLEEDA